MKLVRKRIYEVLSPDTGFDPLSRRVDIFFIILICLNVLAITIESVDTIYSAYDIYFDFFEIFSITIFTVEYLLRIWSSIESESCDDQSPLLTRIKFLITPGALVDLFSIAPFFIALTTSSTGIDLRALRAIRLLRIFKLTRYSTNANLLINSLKLHWHSLSTALLLLFIAIVVSATGIYIFEKDVQPEVFGSIPASMWWAFTTLTTVGYGDVVPITVWGKVFAAMIAVVGVGIVAIPAGVMAAAFSNQQTQLKMHKYNQLLESVYEDGVLDDEERKLLEEARIQLQIDNLISQQIKQESLTTNICRHCGKEN